MLGHWLRPLINKENGNIKSGQLSPGSEYGYYLIKIDGANKEKLAEPTGFGRLEFTYSRMAIDCNIQMTECSLYNNLHFLTKRFDACWPKIQHQETKVNIPKDKISS